MILSQHKRLCVCLIVVGFPMSVLLSPQHACAKDTKPKKGPDCVFVPTPHDIVDKMIDIAKIQKDDVVYDLGCGDGRIVVQAAKRKGCRGVGFEIVPERVQEARESAKENHVSHLVQIKEEDLFKADLSEATVLPIYLLPNMLTELKPKLAKLKPGTRIISHDYRIKGVKPDVDKTFVSKETGEEHTLILYTLPFKEEE
jgi:SAM-dependent methyltransferase